MQIINFIYIHYYYNIGHNLTVLGPEDWETQICPCFLFLCKGTSCSKICFSILRYHLFNSSVALPSVRKREGNKKIFSALYLSVSKGSLNRSQISWFLANPPLAVINVIIGKWKGMYGFSLSVKSTFRPALTSGCFPVQI